MKNFKFRLEKILRLKKLNLDQIANELNLCLAKESAAERLATDLVEAIGSTSGSLGENNTDDLSLATGLAGYLIIGLQNRLKNQRKLIETLKSETEEVRSRYIAADIEVRSLEKLKNIKYKSYLSLLERFEQSQIDEITVQRFASQIDENTD